MRVLPVAAPARAAILKLDAVFADGFSGNKETEEYEETESDLWYSGRDDPPWE